MDTTIETATAPSIPPPDLPDKPTPESPKALGRRIAKELGEHQEGVVGLFVRLATRMGPAFCERIFAETRAIEESGGIYIVSEQRRRTPGGTFLYLAKQDSERAKKAIWGTRRKRKKPAAAPAAAPAAPSAAPQGDATPKVIPPPSLPQQGSGAPPPAPVDHLREALRAAAPDAASIERIATSLQVPARVVQAFADGKATSLSAAQVVTFRGRLAKQLGAKA